MTWDLGRRDGAPGRPWTDHGASVTLHERPGVTAEGRRQLSLVERGLVEQAGRTDSLVVRDYRRACEESGPETRRKSAPHRKGGRNSRWPGFIVACSVPRRVSDGLPDRNGRSLRFFSRSSTSSANYVCYRNESVSVVAAAHQVCPAVSV